MMRVGRLCVKLAGRDAGKKCVVVSLLDKNFVLIDGETRRRKCNILHLEPLDKVLEMKDNAAHAEIVAIFKNELGSDVKASKPKKKTVRPRTLRRSKLAKKPVEKTAAATVSQKEKKTEAMKEEKKAETQKSHRKAKSEKKEENVKV